ncbi:MAG TPA: hypothetical protein VFG54_19900 [Prolixibacteraceae bacterium]|nr:hypothetical protein [Prolixibacteraceae bacterium]
MDQLLRKGLIIMFTGFFILTGISSCKDDYESTVPYVPVNFTLNPTNIIELNIPGGAYYLSREGNAGIIVFRDLIDNSNPFLAYDAMCTYELSPSARVTPIDESSGLAKCSECGSEYILFGGNGSPTKGPAIEPLKQYRTSYTGSLINIRN